MFLELHIAGMVLENRGKNALYTFFEGSLNDLVEELGEFCISEGGRCDFFSVKIVRNYRDSYWTLHEFSSFDNDVAEAIKRHLEAGKDSISIRLGVNNREYTLDLIVCPVENASRVSRFVTLEEMESHESANFVILGVEREGGEVSEDLRRLLSRIENK